MLRPLVAILPGPSLPPMLVPSRTDVTVARFESIAALLARAATEPATCVVADGAVLGDGDAARVRAACPEATVCVIAARHVPGADAVLAPDVDLHDRLAAMIRFALGEPMRCGPRLRASGTLRIDERWALPILDVGEGGVRAAAPPADIIGDCALRIELDDGPSVVACGHEIRRSTTSVVFALNALVSGDRTLLRRWMLGHCSGLARVTHPPRERARRETRTPPSARRGRESTTSPRGSRPR
jgi:hypothetical protein